MTTMTWTVIGFGALLAITAIACSRQAKSDSDKPASEATARKYPHFVFVKVMDPIMPIERGAKYEDPLSETLAAQGLGEVTGGGTQLDKENKVQWIGLDVELANLDGAVEVVRQRLRELGAPSGSVLEFTRDGQRVSVPVH